MIKRLTLLVCGLLLFLVGCKVKDLSDLKPSDDGSLSEFEVESEPRKYEISGETYGIYVDTYDPEKACNGTTLFADLHDKNHPKIIEVNMNGDIVWNYNIPDGLNQYTNPGLDVEWIEDNDHVLFVLPGKGVYEINRCGLIVWQHEDNQISHDADRLGNDNTIYVFGNNDKVKDPQVKEVNKDGDIVWEWYAKDEFLKLYQPRLVSCQGWTHANAVTRLSDDKVMVNLRNFGITTIITRKAAGGLETYYYENIDWKNYHDPRLPKPTQPDPHDPEIQDNGNILVCLQNDSPYDALEIDGQTKKIVWSYSDDNLRTTRDCDKLPNGNVLIVGVLLEYQGQNHVSVIREVTPEKEIVWQLVLLDSPAVEPHGRPGPGWFYKAQRLCQED